jgi:hypothetical protein
MVIIICIFILEIANVYSLDCEHRVIFLDEPTEENYIGLNDECWSEFEKDVLRLTRLYNHAEQANEWAIRYLIKHLDKLDGGELEDALIALGESLHINPIILFREFKEGRMREYSFRSALEMLPLSFVDNKKGTLQELELRKMIVFSINEPGFEREKELAIKVLDDSIAEVKMWPDEEENK